MGIATAAMVTPLWACYAGDGETGQGARDRALGDGAIDAPEPTEATEELLSAMPGYYVLAEGADSEGALASVYLGGADTLADGVRTGESRRREADCHAHDCSFVVADTYKALPPDLGVNEAYLLLDAEREAPQAFYAVQHVEYTGEGDVAALHLRYAPDAETLGAPFVLERWDGATDIRPDLQIDSLDGLPGHYAREGADPHAGEIVDVQLGPDVAGDGEELAGSFIREVERACTGDDCNVQTGDRYTASPNTLGVGTSHIAFETEGGHRDQYIIDEVARDADGTIVRLSLRYWGEHDFGQPFALARRGYGH